MFHPSSFLFFIAQYSWRESMIRAQSESGAFLCHRERSFLWHKK